MPFTLAEWAVGQNNTLAKGVMLKLVQESLVMDILDFESTKKLEETGLIYDQVIEPDFIPLNGTIPERTVRGKQVRFGVHEMAVHIDIPEALDQADGVVEKPAMRQTMLALKGAAYKVNDYFINGDQGVDPYGFDGIEKLVGNLAAAQTVGSSELDITGAPTSAVMHSVLDRLDEGIDAIEGHKPTFGLCNRQFGQRFRSILRRENLLGDNHDWVRNGFPFGGLRQSVKTKTTDPLFVYQGIPFYDIGVKADQTTQIIGNSYAEASSSAATRVYLVKLGEDEVQGLQFSPPAFRQIGLLEDKNVIRHRFTHRLGLAHWGYRGIVKVQGIKAA